jgi:transposase
MYTFYLGIDLHNTKTYMVLIDKAGAVIDERQIRNDDTSKYLEEIVPRETFAVLEATRNWPFMYDLLTAHVERVELAHPKELKAISSAAVKTDRIDARVLAQLARLNYLPTAYAAPLETRDLRLYIRHRETLVQERSQSTSSRCSSGRTAFMPCWLATISERQSLTCSARPVESGCKTS